MDNAEDHFAVAVWKENAGKIFLLAMISFGIIITVATLCMDFRRASKVSDYSSVEAVLISAQKNGDSSNGTSKYTLTYKYEVDGVRKEYTYTTDYKMAASAVPKIGSKKTIKYDPDHTDQVYTEDGIIGIFQAVGVMMIFIPLTMMLTKLNRHKASRISVSIGSFALVALLVTKFNLHQAGFMGILAIAIPSFIGFAGAMELITGRHGANGKI